MRAKTVFDGIYKIEYPCFRVLLFGFLSPPYIDFFKSKSAIMIYLQPLTDFIELLDSRLFQKRWWPWILPLLCWLLSIFFSWRYDHWVSYGWPMDKAWQAYEFKFDHVWEPTRHLYYPGSHQSQLDGRIVVPIIAHYLGLKQTGMMVVYHLCGGLIFLSVYHLAKRYSQSTSIASLFTIGIAGLNCGNDCFSGEPFFDTVCLMFLVLSLLTPDLRLKGLLVVLALLTDERAVCGLPALVAQQFWSIPSADRSVVRRFAKALWPYGTAFLVWIALRGVMWYWLKLGCTGEGVRFVASLRSTWVGVPTAWTGCLEAFWILPILALLALIAKRSWFMTLLFATAVAAAVVMPLCVVDLSRSLIYVLLPLLLALQLLASIEKRCLSEILLLAAVINLLVPNYMVFSHTPQLIPSIPMHLLLDSRL